MASLIKKKKANTIYYYVVESARVDGKPRIVHQTYLGRAESVARLVQDRSAPIPLSATTVDFGLPGALWLAAEKSGVFALLQSLWPKPRSGPSPAHYLLLAAIHRICQPGPKTEVADWYRASILSSLWGFAPERFTSQAFWDCFDAIATGESLPAGQRDELEEAQLRLLGLWKEKQLVTRRLLAYDTTNFYTYIASNNERNSLAQRGHNKQGRHNLRQVGLSYVLDGDNGLSLCHHLYRGNMADAEQFPEALRRIVTLLERNQIAADTVTLVLDKGSAALTNTLELEKTGVGWVSALPWSQAPPELRSSQQLTQLSSREPGVSAAAGNAVVHGKEYQCVVKYSASFATDQLHSLTTSLSRVLQSLRRLAMELKKPKARCKQEQIERKIHRWLSGPFRVAATAPCETTIAVRYLGGRGISRLAFLADRPDFVWRSLGEQPDRHPRLRQAEGPQDQPLRAGRRLRLPPPRLRSTRSAGSRPRRGPGVPGRHRPGQADRARRSAPRPPRVRRLLGPEVGRPAPQRREDDGREGRLGLPALAPRPVRRATSRSTSSPAGSITAQGSTWQNPPASFYRTNRDPMTAAETVGQVFLGVRLQCARCHNHPFDVWTQDDYYGLAAYFGNVAHKQVNNVRRDDLDKHEINGDEMIYLAGQPEMVQPRTGAMMEPKAPRGPKPKLSGDLDARDDLADWLTAQQPPVRPEPGQSRLVPPDRPGRRRAGRRLPRLEPSVQPGAARRPDRRVRRQRVCGSVRWSALIMKSQTYQLGARARTRRTPTTRPTSRAPRSGSCRRRSCSTPSARRWASPRRSATPRRHPRRPVAGRTDGGRFPQGLRQARPPADLRVRAVGVDHSGPGVPVDQRRRGPPHAGGRRQPDRPSAPGGDARRRVRRRAVARHPQPLADDQRARRVPRPRGPTPRTARKAWEDVAWAMINSKEFLLRH